MSTHHLITGPAVLFAPAHRPELFAKAAAKADMVILDLEDGAGDAPRDQTRAAIANSGLDPKHTIVRVCGPEDEGFAGDIEMVLDSPYRLVMIPKVGSELPPVPEELNIIAMIETPAAVTHIREIASHPQVVGLFWGAEDLCVQLGGTHSRFLSDERDFTGALGPYRDAMRLTRAMLLIEAAAQGKFAIDAVHSEFKDLTVMRQECLDAARSGFVASACIHPYQVDTVRDAYRPSPAAVAWAEKVVAEAKNHEGAFKLDGEMVDAPLIAQAERTLRLMGR